MKKQAAAEPRKNLDQIVGNLLGQIDVNERRAVAEKPKQPRDPSP